MDAKGSYNGYTWSERSAMTREFWRLRRKGETQALQYLLSQPPCEMCADPAASQWHAEDYSQPYLFYPPASFALCNTCHGRLHKRFDARSDWKLFIAYLRTGGYGREFTKRYSITQRRSWMRMIAAGQAVEMLQVRKRDVSGQEWWQKLTLDPASLTSPSARPRP